MRILQVLPTLDKSYGGPIVVVEKLTNELRKKNIEIDVFPFDPKINLLNRFIILFKRISKYDLIHIHCIWNLQNSIVSLLARLYNIPYVLTTHGMLDKWSVKQKRLKKYIYFKFIEKSTFKNANYVHFLNSDEEYEANLFYEFRNRIIIPNGSELFCHNNTLSYLSRCISKLKINSKVVLLYMGRLHPKKGLDDLLVSFSKVLNVNPDYHLLIAGGGDKDYVRNLTNLISEFNIANDVTFIGPVYGDDKLFLLSSSDIFILPSFQEGDSVAIKEAMSSYLPVIISKACHFSEVETQNAGKVIDNEIEQIKNAILFFSNDNTRKAYGFNGHKLIEHKYTWKILAEKYFVLYKNIVYGEKF